jgi:hypothetical protein
VDSVSTHPENYMAQNYENNFIYTWAGKCLDNELEPYVPATAGLELWLQK